MLDLLTLPEDFSRVRASLVDFGDQRDEVCECCCKRLLGHECLRQARHYLGLDLLIVTGVLLLERGFRRSDFQLNVLEHIVAVETNCDCKLVDLIGLLRPQLCSQSFLLRLVLHRDFSLSLVEPALLVADEGLQSLQLARERLHLLLGFRHFLSFLVDDVPNFSKFGFVELFLGLCCDLRHVVWLLRR